jgi:hypothetical protein
VKFAGFVAGGFDAPDRRTGAASIVAIISSPSPIPDHSAVFDATGRVCADLRADAARKAGHWHHFNLAMAPVSLRKIVFSDFHLTLFRPSVRIRSR